MAGVKGEAIEGRAYCYLCMRVSSMCLCKRFDRCENRTEIHVLQHERERRHAFGTVRLLRIALSHLTVHRMPTNTGEARPMPSGFPRDAGVLYPGPGSRDLALLAPEEMPGRLVVIDGTWSQAHCMYRDSPWLQCLPRFFLNPEAPSRYRIRKEPRRECLSTLESTAMALRLLEPETAGIDNLLRLFESMVNRQLACIAQHSEESRRIKVRKGRPMRAVPSELYANSSNVVVVYAESALPRSRREKQHRELAQWCAHRLVESETFFDGISLNEAGMPDGYFLDELAWTEEDLGRAEPVESLLRRWKSFVRPSDVLVAWSKGTAKLARQHGIAERVLVLKEIYGNTVVGKLGTLEQLVARDRLEVRSPAPIAGRAQLRLAHARAAASYLIRWGQNRGRSVG